MAQLIETAEQHVALHLGTLTAQNFALACALERRDRLLAEAQARIDALEAERAAATPSAPEGLRHRGPGRQRPVSPAPLTYAWRMARADAAPLGLILRGLDVASGQIVPLPAGGQVIAWSVGLPGHLRALTTEASGGLATDADGVIRFPLAPADLAAAPPLAVMPVVVRLLEGDGTGRTVLLGTLELLD